MQNHMFVGMGDEKSKNNFNWAMKEFFFTKAFFFIFVLGVSQSALRGNKTNFLDLFFLGASAI